MRAHHPPCLLLAAMFFCDEVRPQTLLDQPLEALMEVKLTTLGRRVQPEQDMAIATSVYSGEDLRRGGARTLLDALAWMPGVTVERFNAHTWSVATRGDGASLIAHNTLVMRDGREQEGSGGGPAWGFLNMPIERVQRIEVQRGAGNTLWGANAANCVINVVTRTVDSGSTGAVDADSSGRLAVGAQWGTRSDSGWSTAFWVSGQHQPGSDIFAGRRDWDNQEDRALDATARLTAEGGAEVVFDVNAYNGIGGANANVGRAVVRREGHSTQREWSARMSVPQPQDGRLELAGYAQEMKTGAVGGGVETDRRNVDLSGQRFWRFGAHDVIAGGSVRSTWTTRSGAAGGGGGGGGGAEPGETASQLMQVFGQDEWHFADNQGAVIVGAQGQRLFRATDVDNIYAATLRLRWSATPALSLWAGLSRSGTSPDGGQELTIPSIETGLRWKASSSLQVNAAVFEQRVTSLQVPAALGPTTLPPLDTKLRVRGAEADVHWQATQRWDVEASFTVLRAHFDIADTRSSPLATEEGYFGATPDRTFKARALYRMNDRQSVELGLRARSNLNVGFSPGRGVLDLAYRQQLPGHVEFGSAIQQLNHDSLPSFRPPNTPFPYREVRTLAMWLAWGV